MSTSKKKKEEEQLEQLRQRGFVDVDQWKGFGALRRQQLLGILRNDPQVTLVK